MNPEYVMPTFHVTLRKHITCVESHTTIRSAPRNIPTATALLRAGDKMAGQRTQESRDNIDYC